MFCFEIHQTLLGPSDFRAPPRCYVLGEASVKRRRPPSPRSLTLITLYFVSLLAFWLPCPENGGSKEPGLGLSCPSLQPDGAALLGMSGLNECMKGCLSPGSEGQGVPNPQCCHDFLAGPQRYPRSSSWGDYSKGRWDPRVKEGGHLAPAHLSLPPSRFRSGPEHFSINTICLAYSFSWVSLLPEAP